MHAKYGREEKLKNSLKKILAKEDLALQRELITRLSTELQISILDCAAALSILNQPISYHTKDSNDKLSDFKTISDLSSVLPKPKVVRYRLDIGRKHAVSLDEIKNVLVEVSGVDKKRIGRLDVRNYYTLVDLPDGMPADIFQLLAETEINQQRLNIKRVKFQTRYHRKNNKKNSPKPYMA